MKTLYFNTVINIVDILFYFLLLSEHKLECVQITNEDIFVGKLGGQ